MLTSQTDLLPLSLAQTSTVLSENLPFHTTSSNQTHSPPLSLRIISPQSPSRLSHSPMFDADPGLMVPSPSPVCNILHRPSSLVLPSRVPHGSGRSQCSRVSPDQSSSRDEGDEDRDVAINCDILDGEDNGKVPKPDSEAGRPGRGGYNLQDVLQWRSKKFKSLQVCIVRSVRISGLADTHFLKTDFGTLPCALRFG